MNYMGIVATLMSLCVAVLTLGNLSATEVRDDDLISGAIRLIADTAERRGCMSYEERTALTLLNRALRIRNSPEQIVQWGLPDKDCNTAAKMIGSEK